MNTCEKWFLTLLITALHLKITSKILLIWIRNFLSYKRMHSWLIHVKIRFLYRVKRYGRDFEDF